MFEDPILSKHTPDFEEWLRSFFHFVWCLSNFVFSICSSLLSCKNKIRWCTAVQNHGGGIPKDFFANFDLWIKVIEVVKMHFCPHYSLFFMGLPLYCPFISPLPLPCMPLWYSVILRLVRNFMFMQNWNKNCRKIVQH